MSFGGGTITGGFTASTFTLPSGASTGNFVLVEYWSETTTAYLSGISGGGVTWDSAPLVAPTTYTGAPGTATIWKGQVTATGGGTVTMTASGTPSAIRGNYTVFSTTAGYASVTLDVSGSTNGTTAPPSLTPTHGSGELYYGWQFNSASGTAGTTSGYTYYVDPNANVAMWDTDCTSSVQSPSIGGGYDIYGLAVLLYEAKAGTTLVTAQASIASTAATTVSPVVTPAGDTEAAYTFTPFSGTIVSLLHASDTVTAYEPSLIYSNRYQLTSASADITSHLPSVYVAPNVNVPLNTAIAAVSVTLIGYTPPVEVYLPVAYVGMQAYRPGPPNPPTMAIAPAAFTDGYGNEIPQGFHVFGSQQDRVSFTSDYWYIPQTVKGQTVDVYLPTVEWEISSAYTTRDYNNGIMYSTSDSAGESTERPYTLWQSGSIINGSGTSQNSSAVVVAGESYDSTLPAQVQFSVNGVENVIISPVGLHSNANVKINTVGYNESENTTIYPGIISEIFNQGTSSEYNSQVISAGATNSQDETYIAMYSQQADGAGTPQVEVVMGGSTVMDITNSGTHISGATQLDSLASLNGQTLPLSTVSTVSGSPGSTYTTTTETLITDIGSAVNGIISRLQSIGILP